MGNCFVCAEFVSAFTVYFDDLSDFNGVFYSYTVFNFDDFSDLCVVYFTSFQSYYISFWFIEYFTGISVLSYNIFICCIVYNHKPSLSGKGGA